MKMKFQHTDTDLPIENEYPKLIRDKIPEIIANNGRKAAVKTIADDEEYAEFLLKKVVEEAAELAQTHDDTHLVEEAADVYEVIDALLTLKGLTREDVISVQDEKRSERGGFEKRLLMLHND